MARTLHSAITEAVAGNEATTALLLDWDLTGDPQRWATRRLTWGGESYEPRLDESGQVSLRRSLALDTASVRVENLTIEVSALLRSQFAQGTPATLRRLYLEADQALDLFVGRVAAIEVDEASREATFEIAGGLDPTQRQVPTHEYSERCRWKFKSPECGFVGETFDVCAKTLADCDERARRDSFGGFVHLDRALRESLPPPPDPAELDPRDDFLDYFHEETS